MNAPSDLITIEKIEGLILQHVGNETLLYNERTHQAFCLNPLAAEVWRRLDGLHTSSQIAEQATLALASPVTSQMVLFAIGELQRDGLVQTASSAHGLAPALVIPSRRDLLRQIGAGAVVMLPVVAAVMAPKAAQAYTGCFDCDLVPPTAAAVEQKIGPPKLTPQQQMVIQQRAAKKITHDEGSPSLFVP